LKAKYASDAGQAARRAASSADTQTEKVGKLVFFTTKRLPTAHSLISDRTLRNKKRMMLLEVPITLGNDRYPLIAVLPHCSTARAP
jgi:hypothetical protein